MSKKKTQYSVHYHTIQANRVALRQFLTEQGKLELLAQLRTPRAAPEDFPSGRIPVEIVSNDIRMAAEVTQEENLGLEIIDRIDVHAMLLFQSIDMALRPMKEHMESVPLSLILRLVARYFRIASEVVVIEVNESRGEIEIAFLPTVPGVINYHQIEGAMLGLSRLVFTLRGALPSLVTLQRQPATINVALFKRSFRQIPRFASCKNALSYRIDGQADISGNKLQLGAVINMLESQFPSLTMSEQVRLTLRTVLGFIEPKRENIAMFFSMSVSSFQRRLKSENLTFNEILQSERKKLVEEYLVQNRFNANETAFLLGYRAKSQFLKAFRNWFQMTPSEYLQRRVEGSPER